jgi:hypothetical protein
MTTETSNARGEVGRFRKRPVVIEAVLFDGTVCSADAIHDWARKANGISAQCARVTKGDQCHYFEIETLEGVMRANAGDWIIRGVQGEFYPCKPEIFAATYEPADAAPPPAAARGDVRGLVECLPLEVRATNGYDAAWVAGFNEGVLQSRQNLQRALAAEGVQAGEVEQRLAEDRALLRIASLSQQPEARGVVGDDSRARVQDAIASALGGMALDCLRVWDAWRVGTMGPDDFSVIVDDSDRLAEITDAAIAEMQGEAMTIVRKLAALRDGLDNSNSSAEELAARLAHRAAALTGERNG